MDNPWVTLGVTRIYETGWFAVEEHEVLDPAGRAGAYGVVRAKQVGTPVLAVDDEGFIYLVGQYRYPLRTYSWELPGGGGGLSEPCVAAARRELAEETGLRAETWWELMRLAVSGAVTDAQAVCFVAWGLSGGECRPEPQEVIEIRRVRFECAVRMALGGEIAASPSVATILAVQAKWHAGELPDSLARRLRAAR